MNTFRFALPTVLTLMRIPFSVAMVCSGSNRVAFLICFSLAALTDVLDGYAARRLGVVSALGARLDSLSDFVFFFALLIYLILFQSSLFYALLLPMAVIAAVRIVSLMVCRIRTGRFYSIHTTANRIAGVAIVILVPINVVWAWHGANGVVLAIALLSALEELAIMVTKDQPDPDMRSIFTVGRMG